MVTSKHVADAVATIVALPRPLLLGFDVDGTLAPIVDDPDAAAVPAEVQGGLRRLARLQGVTLALVTGRDRASLSRMARVPGAYRAVEHGRVVIAPGERPRAPGLSRQDRQRLLSFSQWVTQELAPLGAELEVKPQSRGVHVRRLARRAPKRAQALLHKAMVRARAEGLHVREGRAVMEAELSPGDKGVALRALAKASGARAVVYAGDDVTDIPALRAAGDLGGFGIFVRSRERPRKPTGVSKSVSGTDAIAALVAELAVQLG